MIDLKKAWRNALIPDKWVESHLDTEYCFDSDDYVAFQGSQSKIDWIINFMGLPWLFHGVPCHFGFWLKYKVIQKYMKPYDTVTGFSQGAGMALMYALDMRKRFNKEVNVIIFGSPRVLYWPVKRFKGYNLKMSKDIVTIAPPWGFHRLQWNIKIKSDSKFWQIESCHMEYPKHFT